MIAQWQAKHHGKHPFCGERCSQHGSVGLALVRPAFFRDIGAFYQLQYGRTARLVFE